ncbi:MAG: hypothetical protein WDO19_03710 [Bacteroidota bacterium]
MEILWPSRNKKRYESVELTAIGIMQNESNSNEAIHWKLLATLGVNSLSDVLKYIK